MSRDGTWNVFLLFRVFHLDFMMWISPQIVYMCVRHAVVKLTTGRRYWFIPFSCCWCSSLDLRDMQHRPFHVCVIKSLAAVPYLNQQKNVKHFHSKKLPSPFYFYFITQDTVTNTVLSPALWWRSIQIPITDNWVNGWDSHRYAMPATKCLLRNAHPPLHSGLTLLQVMRHCLIYCIAVNVPIYLRGFKRNPIDTSKAVPIQYTLLQPHISLW